MVKGKRASYWAYILECSDGTFYAGYTNNLEKRIAKHNEGKGAKYTRGRLPVKLVYHKEYKCLRPALKAEAGIKKLTRKQKEKLIFSKKKRLLIKPRY